MWWILESNENLSPKWLEGPCQPWQKKRVVASAALKCVSEASRKIVHLGHVAHEVGWKYREVTAREEKEKAEIHYWKTTKRIKDNDF
ncbi:hypothetical protein MC885_002341 [Smutsia gigantea]|nr:hypothetical protein MC885_002341 [Smutsia gigantea]